MVIFFWKAVDRFFRFQWRFLGSEATRGDFLLEGCGQMPKSSQG